MPLFSLDREVEYAHKFMAIIYRARIFWVSEDKTKALAVPAYTRGKKGHLPCLWEKFSDEYIFDTGSLLYNERPVAYHFIKLSKPGRIKLIDEYHSYIHYNGKFMLNLQPKYTKNLPMPHYTQYIKTCYFCETWLGCWNDNAYGV